jgi:alpha-ribazole phosphatase
MRALFVRHGETNYNVLGLCNDDPTGDVYLTGRGLRQAEITAEKLRDVPIERIFISELPRTRQTAEIINRHHGVEISVHPAVNDIRTGFDGEPWEDYRQIIDHDPLHAKVRGGESLLEHKGRVLGFIDWLTRRQEQVVLTVAHEETLRVVVAYFRGLSGGDMLSLRLTDCEVLSFEL